MYRGLGPSEGPQLAPAGHIVPVGVAPLAGELALGEPPGNTAVGVEPGWRRKAADQVFKFGSWQPFTASSACSVCLVTNYQMSFNISGLRVSLSSNITADMRLRTGPGFMGLLVLAPKSQE